MKVKRMIEELQKYNPEAEVKLHHRMGRNALFVLETTLLNGTPVVFLEDKDDCDLRAELKERFNIASKKNMDELDFFTDLVEIGVTLDDIEEYYPEAYEYSKQFMSEHGLI